MVSKTLESNTKSLNLSSPQDLLSTLQQLRQTVESEGKATFDKWNPHIQRTAFIDSALNLAEYLALRRHDLRALQAASMCKPLRIWASNWCESLLILPML